jgi:hypothetical protein
MLAKSFAFILLTLALSPFNAPFQPGDGSDQQIASVEQLSAIRQNSASRAVIAQRSANPDGVAVALPFEFTPVMMSRDSASVDRTGSWKSPSAGDYLVLAAVLRL